MVFRDFGSGLGTIKIHMKRPPSVLFHSFGIPTIIFFMSNDVSCVNLEEAVPCVALSKNDSYIVSATCEKVSLFNMMTFKVMTTFMSPPPSSTFLAFHPQDNNIIAIGTNDSTIHIYNVKVNKVTEDVTYNGCILLEFVPYKIAAYISQYNLHIPEMTARETLDFSTRFQEIMMEVSKKEQQEGIVLDPDVDAYMKEVHLPFSCLWSLDADNY